MAISLQAGPGNNSGSILADGQTVLTFNTTTGVSGVLAPNTVSTASIQNFSVTPNKLSQTAGTNLSSGGFEVLTTNSLDPLGGLEVNLQKQLRIRQAPTTIYIAVRPSVGTDSTSVVRAVNPTSNDPAVLQPYFKSFGGACTFIKANRNNNVVIYIDEDSNELLNSSNLTLSNGTGILQISAVESLPSSFTAAGIKPGAFLWNSAGSNRIFFSALYGNSSLSNVLGFVTVLSRYETGTGSWTTTRKFNQAPKKLIYNAYITNDPTLSYGTLGASASNWSEIPVTVVAGQNFRQYFPFRPILFQNNIGISFINVGLEINTNATDATCFYCNNDRMFFTNCTVKLGGKTRYNWGAVLMDGQGDVQIGTNSNTYLLQSPVPGETSINYPGYGLAVIGNSVSQDAIKMLGVVRLYNNSRLFQINTIRTSDGPGAGAPHTWAFILSGHINIDGGAGVVQNTVTVADTIYSPSIWFVDNSPGTRITGHFLNDNLVSPIFIDYTTPNTAIYPMNFTNYNSYVYTFNNGLTSDTVLSQWTLSLSSTPAPLINGSRLSFWNLNTQFPTASTSGYGNATATTDPNVQSFGIIASLRNINSGLNTTSLNNTLSSTAFDAFVRRPPGLYDQGAYLINGYRINLYE